MDKSKYNERWSDEIRPAILKRDEFKCTRCRVKHRQWLVRNSKGYHIKIDSDEVAEHRFNGHKVVRVYLQVHHIDGNKQNNDYSNLITLCPWCHFAVEKEATKIKRITNN